LTFPVAGVWGGRAAGSPRRSGAPLEHGGCVGRGPWL